MANTQYRHGDILLEWIGPCEQADYEAKPKKRHVVARGEATGHAHVIEAPVIVVATGRDGGDILALPNGGAITHEEHGPIVMLPGRYRVRRQSEWVNVQEVRYVRD